MVDTKGKILELEQEIEKKALMLNTLYDDMANLMRIHSNEILKKDQEIAKLRQRVQYLEQMNGKKSRELDKLRKHWF
jgi:hypothetical protein